MSRNGRWFVTESVGETLNSAAENRHTGLFSVERSIDVQNEAYRVYRPTFIALRNYENLSMAFISNYFT